MIQEEKEVQNLPPMNVEMIVQHIVCINLSNLHGVTAQPGIDKILNAVMFVDLTKGWVELAEISQK